MDTIKKVVIDQDAYAQPVTLNFRGRGNHATFRGGLITLLSYVLTLWLGAELFTQFYWRQDPQIQEYEQNFLDTTGFRFDEQRLAITLNWSVQSDKGFKFEQLNPRAGKMVASSFKIIAAVPDEKSRQEVAFIDCGDVVAELMPD